VGWLVRRPPSHACGTIPHVRSAIPPSHISRHTCLRAIPPSRTALLRRCGARTAGIAVPAATGVCPGKHSLGDEVRSSDGPACDGSRAQIENATGKCPPDSSRRERDQGPKVVTWNRRRRQLLDSSPAGEWAVAGSGASRHDGDAASWPDGGWYLASTPPPTKYIRVQTTSC
jgi:hypothetical protein